MKLKGVCPDNRLPKGLLTEGGTAIKDAIASFTKAKKADNINEKRPDIGPHFKDKVSSIKPLKN